jgi:hypothetical protein
VEACRLRRECPPGERGQGKYQMIIKTHTFELEISDGTGVYFYIENLVLWARSEIDGSALEFCV